MSKLREYISGLKGKKEQLKTLTELYGMGKTLEGSLSPEDFSEVTSMLHDLLVPTTVDQETGKTIIDREKCKESLILQRTIANEYLSKQVGEVSLWNSFYDSKSSEPDDELTDEYLTNNQTKALYSSNLNKSSYYMNSLNTMFDDVFKNEDIAYFDDLFKEDKDIGRVMSFSDQEGVVDKITTHQDVKEENINRLSMSVSQYNKTKNITYLVNEKPTLPWTSKSEQREQSVSFISLQGAVKYESEAQYSNTVNNIKSLYAVMQKEMRSTFRDSSDYKNFMNAMKNVCDKSADPNYDWANSNELKELREKAGKYLSTHISSRSSSLGNKRFDAVLATLSVIDKDAAALTADTINNIRSKEEKKPQVVDVDNVLKKFNLSSSLDTRALETAKFRNSLVRNIPSHEEVKDYGNNTKNMGYRVLDDDTFNRIKNTVSSQPKDSLYVPGNKARNTDIDNLYGYLEGDYSKFGLLPKMFQDYAITNIVKQMEEKFEEGEATLNNSDFLDFLHENSLNPAVQTAFELMKSEVIEGKRNNIKAEDLSAAISYMNSKALKDTLAPVESSVFNTDDVLSSQKYTVNRDKQTVLATTLLLSHLGGFSINPDSTKTEWEKNNKHSMGEMFAHGGRSMFILPKGKKGSELNNLLTGKKNPDVTSGRVFATHDVKVSTKTENGKTVRTFKETKPLTSVRNNYGMNLPIGGLGRKFGSEKSGWTIDNTGRDGHMYIKSIDANAKEPGILLTGIEGEAPGNTGRGGTKHDANAIKAPISVFGATKHSIGKVTDGRRVDLSSLEQNELIDLVSKFQTGYKSLMDMASDNKLPAKDRRLAMEKMNNLNQLLSGTPMDKDTLSSVLHSDVFNLGENNIVNSLSVNKKPLDLTNTEEIDRKHLDNIMKSEKDRNLANPKLSFFMDTLETYKSYVNGDKDAKQIKKLLEEVNSVDFHKDLHKMKEDLTKLRSACDKYMEKVSKMNRKETEKAVDKIITNISKETGNEIERNDKLINKPVERKGEKYGLDNLSKDLGIQKEVQKTKEHFKTTDKSLSNPGKEP